ncbi:hypothetical protein A1O1_04405 [Capronia coronata CBS 617.96]|uniref:ARID domain-containing protein n=1 Tax=Capronia coronata CBS 617.96 TaxID=1182541 RepID=W9YNN5_9EURO|nr:uncharacterized protein A1O1_04405 [Capronia coronata CBS 617.96]EXJ91295.1 hypothetical protein A1O1_04405 [Capronia coronata CBS 617.96]
MTPPLQTIIEDEEEFLKDVAAFHKKRGTSFDREGKVSGRPISLHKLYKLVMARGGYDALSAERMAWRTIIREFGIGKAHEAVMTFQLKTVYYKNLAAYEIATYWGEVPPPKEILEDLSAKGGYLRTRTLENYPIPNSHAVESTMTDRPESPVEEEAHTTPKRTKTETEEPESAGRYPARQLRQDPKRTQMFQPDTQPTRPRSVRATDSPAAPIVAQQTYTSNSTDPRHSAFDWFEKYEPRPSVALTLRPIQTPGNDPSYHVRKAQAQAVAKPRAAPEPQQYLKSVIPIAIQKGAEIYDRCLHALRTGDPELQRWALFHMVKMSNERGLKWKFEEYPYTAEGLIEKALEISKLVCGVKWVVTYNKDDGRFPLATLNGAFGTSDLTARISEVMTPAGDNGGNDLDDVEKADQLERLNEAILVLRNMVMLEDNAVFLSQLALFKEFLAVALSVPDRPQLTEFRVSTLELAEHVTKYWPLVPENPVYRALLPLLDSEDRAIFLTAIRSLNRFGMATAEPHQMTQVPLATIKRLLALTLSVLDNEILEQTLTFLYELTAVPENTAMVLSDDIQTIKHFISRLLNLCRAYYAQAHEAPALVASVPASPKTNTRDIPIPNIPQELHAHLLQFIEPDRSSRWLRCCFEEAPGDDITQVAIWHAYSSKFSLNNPVHAADFIKNVSNTFSSAQAQVINGPSPRFIIKGIRPRRVLLDLHGRPLFQCQWVVQSAGQTGQTGRSPGQHVCGTWQSTRERLWIHIMSDHLRLPKNPKGGFFCPPTPSSNFKCRWTRCSRRSPVPTLREFCSHILTHIPSTPEAMAKLINALAADPQQPDQAMSVHTMYQTDVDEHGYPTGVAWLCVLIMRNLARFANRHGAPFEKDGVRLNQKLFRAFRRPLFRMASEVRTLRDHLVDLLHMIDQADPKDQRGTKRDREDDDAA